MQETDKREKIFAAIRIGIFLIVVGLIIWATIQFMPMVMKLTNEQSRLEFQQEISSLGVKGVFIMLGLEVLQIIIAVIPGQPMEIIAGMLYGTWGGMLLCLVGMLIGTAVVYFTVRRVGMDFIELFFSKKKIEELKESKIFKNERKLELLMFIMFVIPIIPKDIFIYIGGLSPIPPKRFLILATVARIPGLFLTVYAGDKITQGSFWIVAILAVVLIIIALVGGYLSKKAQNKLENES